MPLSAIQPERYAQLLNDKVARLTPAFTALGAGEPEVFASPATGFRLRAEFRIWHSGDDLNYVMFRRNDPKTPVTVAEFPIAAPAIQQLMPRLREALRSNDTLRRKLFQVEFLSTLAGDLLVTLIYHRPLDEDWETAARQLSADLEVPIIGRSRKQKCVLERDWVDEVLQVEGRRYHYRQPEQAFSQPNGVVNQQMIEWALAAVRGVGDDLLELYCGVGNFTLPLAQAFNRVIATELSKSATAAAEYNRQRNGIDTIEFARLSAEEMTDAMAGTRPFRRLQHLHQPLTDYQLNTLLVDPPRAGLDAATLALASSFDNIVYISCNPETLLANLETLHQSHAIERIAMFDQFPYTHHMECGVLLRRRNA